MDDLRTAITGEPDPMPQHAAIEFKLSEFAIEVKRGVLEIFCPREPLSGNQSPVGHDSFACRATLQADLALDDGTNSVSADHDVGLCRSAVRERKMDPIAVFLKLDALVTESDCSFR